MTSRLKEKNDIKILILHLLGAVSYPLEFHHINDMVLQDDFVGGFDFYQCFAELCDSGNIAKITGEEGVALYEITPQGRDVAQTLSSSLLPYIRQRSEKSALRYLDFQKRKVNIKSVATPRDDGKFDLFCSLEENGISLMELKLVVATSERVVKIRETFRDRPEHAYRCLLAVMTGEMDYLLM
ncbi:MAG: DUF4364 family protein [Oscillospiraceae bacterium]|nr:DUF4364 family protein [Oscillospiraceae bacterium]